MDRTKLFTALGVFGAVITLPTAALGQTEVAATEALKALELAANERAYAIDNMFLFIAAVLVLFMQAGFSMLEAGFNSAKNTVNILCKNLMDLCVGVLLFYLIGYKLMYPGEAFAGGFFGFGGFFIGNEAPVPGAGVLHPQVDWLFQVAFAATAATIVSGAVAGRMKFQSYLIYSALLTGLIYPIVGFWKWGGGWLDTIGYYDFAGSVIVHACGGFAALAGAIILGPRIGRFLKDGEEKYKKLGGHNLAMAALGVFILWVGWYGFNPGSQLAIDGSSNTNAVVLVAANTTLAAAAGGFTALMVSWILAKKPEVSFGLNGALAGLVGITANCDSVTNGEAVLIGAIAGMVMYSATKLLERLHIDDPVGAFPVHGAAGVWGGIATALFGGYDLSAQLIGCLAICSWSFLTMGTLFLVLRKFGVLRVSEEEELLGLDFSEHGEEAYYGFLPDLVRSHNNGYEQESEKPDEPIGVLTPSTVGMIQGL